MQTAIVTFQNIQKNMYSEDTLSWRERKNKEVLSWMMEHALKRDFVELQRELTKLFPGLVNYDKLEIEDHDDLLILGTLRKFKKGDTSSLECLNDLNVFIETFDFEIIQVGHPDFVSESTKPSNGKTLLLDFLCQLEHLRDLVALECHLNNFNEEENLEECSPPEKQKIKLEKTKEFQEIKKDVIKMNTLKSHIKYVAVRNIIDHQFVKKFINYLLQNPLNKPTKFEKFIKSRQENNSELETEAMKLLNRHVKKSMLSNSQDDKTIIEKKLITFVKAIAKGADREIGDQIIHLFY